MRVVSLALWVFRYTKSCTILEKKVYQTSLQLAIRTLLECWRYLTGTTNGICRVWAEKVLTASIFWPHQNCRNWAKKSHNYQTIRIKNLLRIVWNYTQFTNTHFIRLSKIPDGFNFSLIFWFTKYWKEKLRIVLIVWELCLCRMTHC